MAQCDAIDEGAWIQDLLTIEFNNLGAGIAEKQSEHAIQRPITEYLFLLRPVLLINVIILQPPILDVKKSLYLSATNLIEISFQLKI